MPQVNEISWSFLSFVFVLSLSILYTVLSSSFHCSFYSSFKSNLFYFDF